MKNALTEISKEELNRRASEKAETLSSAEIVAYSKKTKKKLALITGIIGAVCLYAIIFSLIDMKEFIDIPIFYSVCLLVDIILFVVFFCKPNKVLPIYTLKSEIKKNYHLEIIRNELPSLSKTVSVNADNCSAILIDDENKKILFQYGRKITRAFSFSQITGYDVYENGESKVSGTAGRALLGGVFFGLGGMIVGSSMGRTVSNHCEQLNLIVHLSDLNCFQINLIFINKDCEKGSSYYKKKIENLQYVCSALEYIINQKTLEESAIQNQTKDVPAEKTSNKEKLQELKEMLNDGLITQEDYEQKKKQILEL